MSEEVVTQKRAVITARMSQELHQQLKRQAHKEETSLNELTVRILETYIKEKQNA